MATTSYIAESFSKTEALPLPSKLHEWIVTIDHKRLGIMYIATALFFFVVAGVLAVLMRIQLAFPNGTFLPPDVFNRLFTMHGTSMIFLVGMPFFAGLANYLVPLMIGARRGLVCLRSADRTRVLARHQYRLLDTQHHRSRYRHYGERD